MQSFLRARSYAGLRAFFKIGGVLIGLPPHGGHAPTIVALHWTDDPAGITLHLRRADGTVLHYGPFLRGRRPAYRRNDAADLYRTPGAAASGFG
jgi:hypothetical protein